MKRSRLSLDIMGIIVGLLASLVFFLPIWYFTSTTTINGETTTLTASKVKNFDRETMRDVMMHYENYNHSLNLTFSYVFQILCVITMILELLFIIFTIISISKKYDHSAKIFKISKIISVSIIITTLLAMISALIFSKQSKVILLDQTNVDSTLSMNIGGGIYVFIVFTVFSAICGYVANNAFKVQN